VYVPSLEPAAIADAVPFFCVPEVPPLLGGASRTFGTLHPFAKIAWGLCLEKLLLGAYWYTTHAPLFESLWTEAFFLSSSRRTKWAHILFSPLTFALI
jgi:hypothetical protein